MTYHVPVLLKESMEYLNLKKGGIYVDATLGGGGHTESMLQDPTIKQVFAFDQDEDAVNYASQRLTNYKDKLCIIKSNFSEMRTELALQKIKGVDGILFDLGVSSHQLDEPSRGFSFDRAGDLDMRMDVHTGMTAKELINTYSAEELAKIFRECGEEQAAYKIAQWIVSARAKKKLNTTQDLTDVIDTQMRSNPALVTKTKARIFQAIRIYLNRELELLETSLTDSINLLNPGGRIVVISYHSLEDRIVKTGMQQAAKGCICPKSVLKCVCQQRPKVKIITTKPIIASEGEVLNNSRARSAKLRAAEKIRGESR